jgi:hypothetical protein
MLFVLTMEVLNALIHRAEEEQLFSPLGSDAITFRASFYADDMVIFIKPARQDLLLLSSIMETFEQISGLKTNKEKSKATPINCSEEEVQITVDTFRCAVENFPCRYLGVPLSIKRLRRSDKQPIIDAVSKRIPTWKGNLLNLAGRATLVSATLSAIPVYISIAVCLSSWALGCIDRSRRAFLWTGAQTVAGGKCRVAWRMVSIPKELGGLGIIDLRRLGIALRLRWEWLRRTDPERSWHALPSHQERAVRAFFQVAVHVEVGNGSGTFFWTDRWINGHSIGHIAPSLLAAVPKRLRRRSVSSALANRAWAADIRGARTV